MSRPALAFLIGTIGFFAYIVAVMIVGDLVVHRHWAIQLLFYVPAGILWVWPAKWLMFWAARKNG